MMSQASIITQSYIEKTPGVLGGDPRIAGLRIGVATLVDLYLRQDTPIDEIIERLPLLTPSQVHAAMAYYYDHQEEIDAILAEEDALFEAASDPIRDAERRERAYLIGRQKLAETLASGRADSAELTVIAVAQTYKLDAATVRRAAIDGDIPARKSGATWLITLADAHKRWGYRLDDPPPARQPGRPAHKSKKS